MIEDQQIRFSIRPAYSFGEACGLEKEICAIREMDIEWDLSYTTSLRKGYVVELFERRGVFDEFKAKHWPLGNTAAGEKERQRVLRIKEQYEAFLAGGRPPDAPRDDEAEVLMFPPESHLRDFIARNIGRIKLHGLALRLYVDSSGRNGVEYPTDVGPIDVLAEKSNGDLVLLAISSDTC